MSTAHVQAQPPADINTIVSSDMLALESHMSDCLRSQGPFFRLLSALEWTRALASSHIVTTGALVGGAALGLLLTLA